MECRPFKRPRMETSEAEDPAISNICDLISEVMSHSDTPEIILNQIFDNFKWRDTPVDLDAQLTESTSQGDFRDSAHGRDAGVTTQNRITQEDNTSLVTHKSFADGFQLMGKVAQAESSMRAISIENQRVVDPPSTTYTGVIENFSNAKEHSDIFPCGGYDWRVRICSNNFGYLSIYLDVVDSASFPCNWSIRAQFSLAVICQINIDDTVRYETHHEFNAEVSRMGYESFMPLSKLHDLGRGYIDKDTVKVAVEVAVEAECDSKKETGYAGLKYRRTARFMNSILQILYHIPCFRKVVHKIPTTMIDKLSDSVSLTLQTLFCKLQCSDKNVALKEMIPSLPYLELEVLQSNRVLCEMLGDEMKETVVEGCIQELFEGRCMNYIKDVEGNYKSKRNESFFGLSLDVKGCQDVYASFDKYVKVECMQHGLQDATKGVLFTDFPPVLQLELKRFDYSGIRTVKINDHYVYPLQLDLDRDNGKYLSPEADKRVRNLYTLHSVLVHSESRHHGPYYAFIRPTLSDQWFKFHDERVTKEDMKRALEEQYGGEVKTYHGFSSTLSKAYSQAYMLIYIRESDKEKIMCTVDEEDIAEHVRTRLKKENEEKEHKKRKKEKDRVCTTIKVAQEHDLFEHTGSDVRFDLVDFNKVWSFCIENQRPFIHLKKIVSEKFCIPEQFQWFWLWAKCENNTYCLTRPLTFQEEQQSVGQLREILNNGSSAELKLFLDVKNWPNFRPISLLDKMEDDIFLFFKLYDPDNGGFRYVGNLFVKGSDKPVDILTILNGMADFDLKQEIELYKEIKTDPSECVDIDNELTFRSSQIENGDVICFQKPPSLDSFVKYQYRSSDPSLLTFVYDRLEFNFQSLKKPGEDFSMFMSKFYTYDDIHERFARELALDPTKIRLTNRICPQQPDVQSIEYGKMNNLRTLVLADQIPRMFHYEILDVNHVPPPDVEDLQTLSVSFRSALNDEVMVTHSIRLPKRDTVANVFDHIRTLVVLSRPNAELRLLGISLHRICVNIPPSEKIGNINSRFLSSLRVEEIPEEERNLGPRDCLVPVLQFRKATAEEQRFFWYFGEPFFLIIHKGESLAEIKVRIKKKFRIPEEKLVQLKFSFIPWRGLTSRQDLLDSDIVFSHFQKTDTFGEWKQHLGLEHYDIVPHSDCS